MRIISGKYKGRAFHPPANLPVRPTTDFAKTGLFNVLSNRIEFSDCKCLDLFSGTGSISVELASRGCKSILSIDRDFGCIGFLNQTAIKLGEKNIKAVKSDVFKYLLSCREKFDLIFADPPFDAVYRNDIHKMVFEKNLLTDSGLLVIEHASDITMEHLPFFDFEKSYGNVRFSFFHKFETEPS